MTVYLYGHLASQNIPSASNNYAKAKNYHRNVKKYKFLRYLHFLIDFVKVLRVLSLMFQNEKMLVCSVSSKVKKRLAQITNLKDVPGERYEKFVLDCELSEEHGEFFKGVILSDRPAARTRRQTRIEEYLAENETGAEETGSRNNTYGDTFHGFINNTESYIKRRFKVFEEESLVWFKIFDTDLWSSVENQRKFGNEEITKLLEYYKFHRYMTEEECKAANVEWPSLKVEALNRKCSE